MKVLSGDDSFRQSAYFFDIQIEGLVKPVDENLGECSRYTGGCVIRMSFRNIQNTKQIYLLYINTELLF